MQNNEALCRALKQREIIKQEYSDFQQLVSDAVSDYFQNEDDAACKRLCDFIILKPDPLVELMERCSGADAKEGETWEEAMARNLRVALDARGLTIVEVKNDE